MKKFIMMQNQEDYVGRLNDAFAAFCCFFELHYCPGIKNFNEIFHNAIFYFSDFSYYCY